MRFRSYYGGNWEENGLSVITDSEDRVYLCGRTRSTNAISTTGAYQVSYGGGDYDAFLVKFNSSGIRQWGTYYGGTSEDCGRGIIADADGYLFLCGYTQSTNAISTTGAHQVSFNGVQDAFLVKFESELGISEPVLSSPTNNAIGVQVMPVFIWNNVNSATSYSLQVSTSPSFTSTVVNVGTTSNTYTSTTTLNCNSTYYWRVKASTDDQESDWSEIWNFIYTLNNTVIPSLITPSDNSYIATINPDFIWEEVSCATSYTLQLSTNPSFTDFVVNTVLTANSYTCTTDLDENTTYYWRVKASNDEQETGWSQVFGFETIGAKYLYSWGYSYYGQLGIGESIWSQHQIGSGSDWVKVSCGMGHTLAIKSDGTLWACGYNATGQLGLGSDVNYDTPTQVGTATNWVQISAGGMHSLAIKSDGTLWAWGDNSSGQLGFGSTVNVNTPTQVGTATNWAFISAGGAHSLAIKTDGTLWTWGSNEFGQLGFGNNVNVNTPTQVGTATNWAFVSGGTLHSLAIKTNGTLWTWGNNQSGQLGDGSTSNRLSPVQIGSDTDWQKGSCGDLHTLAIKTDGTLWACGGNFQGQLGIGNSILSVNTPVQIGTDTDWELISSGYSHSMGVKTDGTLWAWGNNIVVQLGLGNSSFRLYTPEQVGTNTNWEYVSCGADFTISLNSNNTLWASGINNHGQLGDISTSVSRSSPETVNSSRIWRDIASGNNYSIGIKSNGTIWSWGYNNYGQLGNGSYTSYSYPIQIGNDTDWALLSCGSDHTSAIKTDGTLWAWGYNNYGQLGNSENTDHNYPLQIETGTNWATVSCGGNHTIAIKADRTLWAWGYNINGQLGDGTNINRNYPVQIGTGTSWAKVSCGGSHSLGIKTDGTLWAWGLNIQGQLGDGTTTQRNSPVQIGTGTNWASVSCGGSHSLGIKTDGTLWAWGFNDFGQLGDGSTTSRNTPVQIGTGTNWSRVSCGGFHTLACKTDGTLWAWGYNINGQLGDGSTTDRNIPIQVGANISWSSISCGEYHSLGLSSTFAGPILISPENFATNVTTTPIFQWNEVNSATSYTLQVSTSPSFTDNVINSTTTSTSFSCTASLELSTTYYWRAKAIGNDFESGWSEIWQFYTEEISGPILISPENNQNNVSITPTFVWNSVNNATSYTLQLCMSPSFTNNIIDVIITSTSYTCTTDLEYNKTYFWRAKALNDNQESSWSDIWQFTTIQEQTGYSLSGLVTYANTAQTPMNNCLVLAKDDEGNELGRATTNSSGSYTISNLTAGTITIEIQTNKSHGGVNISDVLQLRQKIGNLVTFNELKTKAADINNSGSINISDVLPMRQKIAGVSAPNWLIANYVFYPLQVEIIDSDVELNIEALCGGDVNGSFTPDDN